MKSTKAYIKDLELQIDYLIGYAPQGLHWKKEYHFREELISNTLVSENTPQEIVDKIALIQGKIYELRENKPIYQGYLPEDHETKKLFKIHDYTIEVEDVQFALPEELMDKRAWRNHNLEIKQEYILI